MLQTKHRQCCNWLSNQTDVWPTCRKLADAAPGAGWRLGEAGWVHSVHRMHPGRRARQAEPPSASDRTFMHVF